MDHLSRIGELPDQRSQIGTPQRLDRLPPDRSERRREFARGRGPEVARAKPQMAETRCHGRVPGKCRAGGSVCRRGI
jgi:hypothetical protein